MYSAAGYDMVVNSLFIENLAGWSTSWDLRILALSFVTVTKCFVKRYVSPAVE